MPTAPTPRRRPRPTQAGFTMLEILIGGALLAIALLGHTASIFSEQRLSASERARSTALLASEQFLEHLRADDSWATLYSRLHALAAFSRSTPESGYAGSGSLPPAALKDFVTLSDGRRAFVPAAYYDDFVVPTSLLDFHVVVDVPAAPDASDPLGPTVLREDLPLPRFGLPYDLDGDGFVTAAKRDDDYVALPIILTVRWAHTGGGTNVDELSISSWLWGYR